jgi:FKBP-type peptidyl-prolyl cis-trans isomerase
LLPRVRRLIILLCLVPVLGFAGCGDDEEEGTAAPATTSEANETPAAEQPSSRPAKLRRLFAGISKDLSEKPAIPTPEGDPPAQLIKRDLVKGSGRAAREGDQIAVQYLGASWSTGQQFDSSWDRGREPFRFTLGAGDVIPGWDQGIVGMRPRGRRVLVIPPELAYGEAGAGEDIAPNETLIFVVDLEKIER